MTADIDQLRVVLLAGGVGGAKLAVGLDKVLDAGHLTVVVNTGDDFVHFGLKICPDLDTVCYALGGLSDETHGWGLANDTWEVRKALEALGAPTWFQLGDRDLATHLTRTHLLHEKWSLTEITRHFCKIWKINSRVLPMTDADSPTFLEGENKEILSFQEYFVHQHFQPKVRQILFPNAHEVKPTKEVCNAIDSADLVFLGPSNPWVSIDPILAVSGMREKIRAKKAIAVSPIVQGRAFKGPASKMFTEMGIQPSSKSVLKHFEPLLRGFIHDQLDDAEFQNENSSDIIIKSSNTVMNCEGDKIQLARTALEFGQALIERG